MHAPSLRRLETRRGLVLKLPVDALAYPGSLQHRPPRRLDSAPHLVQRLPQPPLLLGLLRVQCFTRLLADYVEVLLTEAGQERRSIEHRTEYATVRHGLHDQVDRILLTG